jgi:hypothetical protein
VVRGSKHTVPIM